MNASQMAKPELNGLPGKGNLHRTTEYLRLPSFTLAMSPCSLFLTESLASETI
jgi:hypothetical protein